MECKIPDDETLLKPDASNIMKEINATISLDALKNGDQEAFARLVDETSAHIYRVILQITGNEQDAEDMLQETYIKAFHSVADFEGRSSLKTWLYRIAVNEALMSIRKHKHFTVSIDESGDEEDPEGEGMQIIDWCCQPEREMLSTEARRKMDEAVNKLPETLRVVFVMRDLEGLSIQETAEVLNLTESTVKVRLLRARLRLREELSLYFGSKMQEKMQERMQKEEQK
jgi:RNA polymerase sigma-70 factor, ECF subfamily